MQKKRLICINVRNNLYFCGVESSRAGKEAVLKVIKRLKIRVI